MELISNLQEEKTLVSQTEVGAHQTAAFYSFILDNLTTLFIPFKLNKLWIIVDLEETDCLLCFNALFDPCLFLC